MLYDLAGVASKRVLLVGFGTQNETAAKELRDGVRGAVRAMVDAAIGEAALYVSDVAVRDRDAKWVTMQAAMASLESTYRFDRLKSKSRGPRKNLKRIVFGLLRESKVAGAALERGIAIGEGVNFARDLGNLPPNICTPTYLAEQARALGKTHKLKVTVLERKDMEKLGMGSLLSVADGSRQPPKLITIEYYGGPEKQKALVLGGKGITFDNRRISFETAAPMGVMEYDMSWA